MSNLLPEVVIWWTLKMYFLEVHIAHEYSVRVMGLERFLLHCNASNLLIYIFKHDKIWGTMCISVPTPNFGGLVPPFPRDLRPSIRFSLSLIRCCSIVVFQRRRLVRYVD